MNFGTLEFELYMLEVQGIKLLYFWKTEIIIYAKHEIKQFLGIIKRNVQHGNCLLGSLVYPYEFSELLVK